jgi:hypothetical protein
MTYGRVYGARYEPHVDGAAVSHLAELVRGDFNIAQVRPPHPAFGYLLPKGRRDMREQLGIFHTLLRRGRQAPG